MTPAGSTESFSSWVIWPIFSSIVISARRASARTSGGRLSSCQSVAADGLGLPVGGADTSEVPQAPATRAATTRNAISLRVMP